MPADPSVWKTGATYRISGSTSSRPDSDETAPIFILASSQRSGTTLLQRLLNSHPEVMIWGEQDGYLERWLQEFSRLEAWAENKLPEYKDFQRAGYNQFLPNICPPGPALKRAAQAHVLGLFQLPTLDLGRPIWGFKEVRYTADLAVMLQDLFPKARFIHVTRDIRDVFLSLKRWELSDNWQPEWTTEVLKRWVIINDSFEQRSRELNQLVRVKYEDMVADSDAFTDNLETFLKMSAGSLDKTVFRLKLDGTHSHAPYVPLSRADEDVIRRVPGMIETAMRYGYDLA